jgi:hypothetical protein
MASRVAAFDWLSRRGKPADRANSRGRRPGSPWAAAAVGQRRVLAEREAAGEIAARGKPAPVQACKRWAKRHDSGATNGKLRRRRAAAVCRRVLAGAGQRRHRAGSIGASRLGVELTMIGYGRVWVFWRRRS